MAKEIAPLDEEKGWPPLAAIARSLRPKKRRFCQLYCHSGKGEAPGEAVTTVADVDLCRECYKLALSIKDGAERAKAARHGRGGALARP